MSRRLIVSMLSAALAAIGGLPPEHIHISHDGPASSVRSTAHRHFAPHHLGHASALHDADDDHPHVVDQTSATSVQIHVGPSIDSAPTVRASVPSGRGDVLRPFQPPANHGPPGAPPALRAPPVVLSQ